MRAAGGLCIADEVQTGFGRTGKHYWGFEAHGVVPDIVTMAKGIGNGLPLGAVVTTREVAACLAERLHFNTFGGNPVCAAGGKERRERERERETGRRVWKTKQNAEKQEEKTHTSFSSTQHPNQNKTKTKRIYSSSSPGRAVLAAVDHDRCQQVSLAIGDRLVRGLKKIQKSNANSVIGDVRGSGLMLGIDLVSDSKTKEANPAAAAAVSESLKQKGILIGKGGLRGNVLRVKPPMCWSEGDADFFLEAFGESLQEL